MNPQKKRLERWEDIGIDEYKKHSQIEVIENADREYLMRFCKEYIDMPEIIAPQA